MTELKDRVIDFRRVRASELVDHPGNWRLHPDAQKHGLQAVMREIGFAGAILAREDENGTLHIIDGHLRKETAGDADIPVLVTDLTPEEADALLAVYDPLAAMAETRAEQLGDLLAASCDRFEGFGELMSSVSKSMNIAMPSVDEWGEAFNKLPDGEKSPFQQMTFTLHDEQAQIVKDAIAIARGRGNFEDSQNQNSNGNALAFICEMFMGAIDE